MYNLTDLANKIIQVASQYASHSTNEVGTEHILYAFTKVESKAKTLLQAYHVDTKTIQEILDSVGSKGTPSNFGVITFKDTLCFTLTTLLIERKFISKIYDCFKRDDVSFYVETNDLEVY